MNIALKATLLIGVLALSACTNPNRFGGSNAADQSSQASAGGIDQTALGAAGDPRSPEYFAQAIGDRVLFAVDQSRAMPTNRARGNTTLHWAPAGPTRCVNILCPVGCPRRACAPSATARNARLRSVRTNRAIRRTGAR